MTNKTVNSIFDILCLLFSPLIFIGLAIYACATILWLYILSKADLSFVYPIQSLAYVFALFLAFFLFKENVSLNRWLGTIVICFGVYLISIK